jgi:hypothetical protein
VKKLLVIAMLVLAGCTDMKSESEQNSQDTIYRYGLVVKIKRGFFREYSCALIREYSDSVFCKIILTPDGERVQESWQSRENFQKSNIEMPKE